jgi:serine/threonine-protein kinase RsbW
MKDIIKIEIPKKSEYISVLRLTTSSIGNKADFNIEEIDDLKVIISEICIFFINNINESNLGLNIEFKIEKKNIEIEVKDLNKGTLKFEENDMCILIIESLSDVFKISIDEKKVYIKKKC